VPMAQHFPGPEPVSQATPISSTQLPLQHNGASAWQSAFVEHGGGGDVQPSKVQVPVSQEPAFAHVIESSVKHGVPVSAFFFAQTPSSLHFLTLHGPSSSDSMHVVSSGRKFGSHLPDAHLHGCNGFKHAFLSFGTVSMH
jgi:hypothetical protein